jgi:SET domain-containing protein
LIARRDIAAGTILFGEDSWADEAERRAFVTLSEEEFAALTDERRNVFLRFAYNTGPHEITGTFTPEAARHPTNFSNHSCDPNSGYDGADHIVALKDIRADDEIVIDYGTFSFSFDHAFACRCGAKNCRGKVTRNDWPALVRAGLRLPSFMKDQAARVL